MYPQFKLSKPTLLRYISYGYLNYSHLSFQLYHVFNAPDGSSTFPGPINNSSKYDLFTTDIPCFHGFLPLPQHRFQFISAPPPPYLKSKAGHQTQPSRPAKPSGTLDAELFHPLIVAGSTIYITSFLSPPPPRHTPVQHRSTNHYPSVSLLHASSQEPITFPYHFLQILVSSHVLFVLRGILTFI